MTKLSPEPINNKNSFRKVKGYKMIDKLIAWLDFQIVIDRCNYSVNLKE